MSTQRTGFSKRRSRRTTSFPLVAVIQRRYKPNSISPQTFNKLSKKIGMPSSVRESQSIKRSRGTIDYKNVVLLRKLITAECKILPRRINKLTAKQQRYTSKAIKSARIMGLLPFINKSRSLTL
jgi:small subunit ribosomal protein S18